MHKTTITPREKYDAENAKLEVAAMPFFILLAAIELDTVLWGMSW